MATPLRFATCNELFERMSFAEGCQAIRETRYAGIEIAPFTLAPNPVDLTRDDRQVIKGEIARNRLGFVGFHWILAAPPNLHATTPDKQQRQHTWQYLARLIDLCADVNPQPAETTILVFGSPKQRSTVSGMNRADAAAIMTEGLARLAPQAASRNIQVLVEALPSNQSDVINTLEEAVAIVEQIASPAIQTMFDVHNTGDETLPHDILLRKYWRYIRHIHVNEMDGREPGQGDYDFAKLLTTLEELRYSGWVSLEAFDFSRDPRQVAAGALNHLLQFQTL
jgi:D-psicose/D-tagatose/L-ribulose 3-epimerase